MKTAFKSIFAINPITLTCLSILLIVVLFVKGIAFLDMIELKTYDLRFLSRGPVPPSPTVAIASIDEKSLDAEGRWPWPRSRIAALLDVLSGGGAAVIGFDIGFLEPDENAQLNFIRELDQQVTALDVNDPHLKAFIESSKQRADNDLALADAIKRSSAAIVLGYFFHMSASDIDYRLDPAEIDSRLDRLRVSKYPLIRFSGTDPSAAPLIRAYAPESNLEIFTDSAESSGFFSLRADPDGTIRWMPLIIQCGEDLFPPLAVLCAWHFLHQPPFMVEVSPYGVDKIRMGQRVIPTDENGQLLINYLGPPKTFPHYPVSDILNGTVEKNTFKDAIVLVGATAMGIHDIRSTPVSPVYPGVEIHATVIENILTQNYLTRPQWSKIFDLVAIILLGGLAGVILPRTSALKGIFVALGLFALYVFVSRWLFVHSRVWLNTVYPLLVLATTYTVLTAYHYVTEERTRKRIKGAFRHYVAPLVVEEMLKAPGQLKLGGEERVISVLFCDLEGFTSYAERYSPQEIINTLSEYFENMTEQIFTFRGTLKGYVGDELMAMFGAPLWHPDHAERACGAALAMRERLQQLCTAWTAAGRVPLKARTGINSGSMIVGNLGSRYRFTYDALGDEVNLGSRIEGLNKVYGTDILIGENTADLVRNSFILREVDMVRVVGRRQCLTVYELVARTDTPLPEKQLKALRSYAAGLTAYREQRWQEAMALFETVGELNPGDGPAQVMTGRCRDFLASPPPKDWDCVYEPLTK